MPDDILDALVENGLPPTFAYFELDFSVRGLHTTEWDERRFLVLGTTESGAMAVDIEDGTVWWLQRAITGRPEIQAPAYRQYANRDVGALVRCVEAYTKLLDDGDVDASRLAGFVNEADADALAPHREGGWREVVLDWNAGL